MRLKFTLCCLLVGVLCAHSQTSTEDEKQRVHSAQIHQGSPNQIQDRLATSTKSDVFLLGGPGPLGEIEIVDDPLAPITNMSCDSDLVALGVLTAKTSHPTKDNGYIYTDWDFKTEEVIKNNKTAPVQAGQTITVTRPGGTIDVDGRHVHAVSTDFPEFQIGQEVLLFLHYLPTVNTYSLRRPYGFTFSGTSSSDLARRSVFNNSSKSTVLDLSRKASSAKCPKQGGQQ
jgi:hypothetical protein